MELLETLAVVIGVVLVLALATQALQEVLSVAWPVEAQARLGRVRGLVAEAARAARFGPDDAEALAAEVTKRLAGLGHDGVRRSAVRLDGVDADSLVALVERLDPTTAPGLAALRTPEGSTGLTARMKTVAGHVRALYPLALSGVESRTTRRTRVFSLVTSLAVVLALNVDVLSLWSRVNADRTLRRTLDAAVAGVQARLGTLEETRRPAAGQAPAADALATAQDKLDAAVKAAIEKSGLVAPGGWRWGHLDWWLGIALTTLLVSLGMPFWRETLGALTGLRKRATGSSVAEQGG